MPGLSGLFNMATEFFQAWAKHANFETTQEKLREATSPFTDEGRSLSLVVSRLYQPASQQALCPLDRGSFSLLPRRRWPQQYHRRRRNRAYHRRH